MTTEMHNPSILEALDKIGVLFVDQIKVTEKWSEKKEGYSYRLSNVSDVESSKQSTDPDYKDLGGGEYRTIDIAIYNNKNQRLLKTLTTIIFQNKDKDVWEAAESFFTEAQAGNTPTDIWLPDTRVFDAETPKAFKGWDDKNGKWIMTGTGTNKTPWMSNLIKNIVVLAGNNIQDSVRRQVRRLTAQKAWVEMSEGKEAKS